LGPASGLVLESWGQQPCHLCIHVLGENWSGMYLQPAILPRAPDMLGQTDRHRWGPWRAALPQAFMGPHAVGEAHHQPAPAPVAGPAPGQTAGAAPQGGDQPTQGPIPALHEGGLERGAACSQAPRWPTAAGTAAHDAPAPCPHLPRLVADLDNLGVAQVVGRNEPGVGVRPTVPRRRRRSTTPTTWSNAAREAFQPSGRKLGTSRTRATPCATNAAAGSCGRGPTSTPSRPHRPIATAVWSHAPWGGRSVACAASHWTPGTSTSRPTWRWGGSARWAATGCKRCTVLRAPAPMSAVPASQTPQRCPFSRRTTVSSGSFLRANPVPSRSEHARPHAVQRSRSRCVCVPVHDRCAL
jgi:hypothetical protein